MRRVASREDPGLHCRPTGLPPHPEPPHRDDPRPLTATSRACHALLGHDRAPLAEDTPPVQTEVASETLDGLEVDRATPRASGKERGNWVQRRDQIVGN